MTGYTRGGLDGNTSAGLSDLFVVKYNSDYEEIVGQFPSPLLILQFSTTISEAIKQTVLSNVTYLLLKKKWVV